MLLGLGGGGSGFRAWFRVEGLDLRARIWQRGHAKHDISNTEENGNSQGDRGTSCVKRISEKPCEQTQGVFDGDVDARHLALSFAPQHSPASIALLWGILSAPPL